MFKKHYFMVLHLFFFFQSGFAAPKPITLLHTNDLHTQYTPLQATWIKTSPKPMIGGMAALAELIESQRNENCLLIDAGDFLTGTLLSKMSYKGIVGGGIIEMMNMINYDVSVVGNHDFDNSRKTLEQLMAMANFDILSANLVIGDSLFTDPVKIMECGGLSVGLIGLTISPLLGLVPASSLDSVRSAPLAPKAQKWIDFLDPVTDLIVLLTHQGAKEDSLLATQLQHADVIVGGHSHTRLNKPWKVNDIIIVQAGSRSRYLGRLDLMVDADSVSSYKGELLPVWADHIDPNTPMAQMVKRFSDLIDAEFGDTIAVLKHSLSHNRYSKNKKTAGSVICQALLEKSQADFSLMNHGGIRKTLAAGPVTPRDILEMLPFTNKLVRFQCSGRQLRQFIEKIEQSRISKGYDAVLHSGFSYNCQTDPDSTIRLTDIKVKGVSIHPDSLYTGSSIDYVIIENTQRYLGFTPTHIKIQPETLSDFMIHYFKKKSTL